jgi:hypothetical protein
MKVCRKEIFDEVKFVIPGSLHTPENLKAVITEDTDFYAADAGFNFQGSILQNSISAENFSDKMLSSHLEHISTPKTCINLYWI